jgi:hypothetical protein
MNEAPMPEPQDIPSVPEQVPLVTLPDAVMFPSMVIPLIA